MTHSCTEIGCLDSFTLNLSLPSGQTPNVSVDLLIDGVAVYCPVLDGQASVRCADNVTSSQVQGQTCVDSQQGNAVTHTCTGNGIYHLSIRIAGAPKSVSYTVKASGTVVAQDTVSPAVQPAYPNGPDCDPACKQGSVDVTLPAS